MTHDTLAPYPSPEAADAEIDALIRHAPQLCRLEVIGTSTNGRPIRALRIAAPNAGGRRPSLLVTAHIHAVEYIGSYVARAVARRLVAGFDSAAHVTALLERADVWMVPLLNPDGATRVWQSRGWTRLGSSRFTANGVDPNRNFPFVATDGRRGWNTGRDKPGSPYYRGPLPLSEPECLALARLCRRQRFCAAVNFHSFGGVVFIPEVQGADSARAKSILAAFEGPFQSHQTFLRYRPVHERAATIVGQLDSFLLYGLGIPSVTVEVSRPGRHLLLPWNTFKVFWWANPSNPQRWADNDAEATVHVLGELLERSGGEPCQPALPELADQFA
ncbi:MAG TPA: M14 family metallopeptidase [Candidatus Acidoferrales bacterium]|nr:M14 family metallopeptidase [Candidatus Acidoferrales bacterium]